MVVNGNENCAFQVQQIAGQHQLLNAMMVLRGNGQTKGKE
jgi:hypothetical protein